MEKEVFVITDQRGSVLCVFEDYAAARAYQESELVRGRRIVINFTKMRAVKQASLEAFAQHLENKYTDTVVAALKARKE